MMETSLVSSASVDQIPASLRPSVSLRSSASSIPTSFGSPATFRITLPPSVTRSPCASPSLRRSSSQVKIIASSSPNLSVTIETPLEQTQEETTSLSSSPSPSSSSQLTIITVQSDTANRDEDNDEQEHSPSSPLLSSSSSSSSSTPISEAELERRRLEAALEYETQEQADTAVVSSIKFFAVGFLVLFLIGAILTFIHTGLIFQLDDYCTQELHRLTYPWGADTATDSKYTYKVAFVGNTGEKPKDVWKLIEKEGADALVHMGDYASEVESLRQQLLENFSGKLPVILNLGDQNAGLFKQTEMKETVELAFQRILSSKYETHYSCDGEVGLRTVCSMHNAVIISLATNLGCCDAKMDYELWLGKWDRSSIQFSSLSSVLSPILIQLPSEKTLFRFRNTQGFKFCTWHSPSLEEMELGKENNLARSLFDICRKHGAVIITGDQHLYTRTHSISEFDFEESSLVQSSDYLKLNRSKIEVLRAVPGRTFIVNSGLGGQTPAGAGSLTNPSVYAKVVGKDANTSPGVFFCELKASPPELKYQKDKDIASKGYCYFKNVDDEVLDRIIVQIK